MEHRKTPIGALWALLASLIFSVNDMLIKLLSDGYALHQIVFTRSLTGVLLLMIVIIPFSGGYGALRTQRLGLHLVRALFVVAANLFFYMALADMPLAIVVAIFFIAPFLITIFSVIFLGETRGQMAVVGDYGWTHWCLADCAAGYGCLYFDHDTPRSRGAVLCGFSYFNAKDR
ncbi:DMT family transporter [uncultured Planktomarina sp.]|uniref:DMT family transporter n=1 Tax=uncultured Planktomarina sp. TaxID=1538529 RepID=UPI003261D00A